MKQWIKKAIEFVKTGIWQYQGEKHSRFQRWIVGQMKVYLYPITGFGRHQIGIRSAALTFYTLTSIVPVLAMIFGIAKGFGLEDWIQSFIEEHLGTYKALFDQIMVFAQKFLERTKGGIVAGAGFFVLVWSVVMVFGNIERAFNDIWEVRKRRTISRKVSDYMSVLFILPILYAIYNGIMSTVRESLFRWASDLAFFVNLANILLSLAPIVVIWFMFTMVYFVLPNTNVKFSAAFRSGVIIGTAYYVFQALYIYFQTSVSNYNIIYGSFAALPLFLLWLNITWQIILFGAELSYAYQNIQRYEFERESYDMSNSTRRKVLLVILSRVVKDFLKGGPLLNEERLSTQLDLPIRVVRDILYELEQTGFVVSIDMPPAKAYGVIPAKDINRMTIWSVIEAVDRYGVSQLEAESLPEFQELDRLMEEYRKILKTSGKDVLLKDL